MEYAFIVNPASGNGKNAAKLREELEPYSEKENVRIYCTEGEKDATVLAASIAEAAARRGETVNIYACGGDGTIQETAKGIYHHPNARLGVIPVGSGNDFVRCFEDSEAFLNIGKQMEAGKKPTEELKQVDLLEYVWEENGEETTDYAINGINIGFDGNTAILAHDLKELPLVQGSGSYLLAVLINLIRKKGTNLKVTAEGKAIYDGPLILCTAANGRFCGGGVESCPHALLDNGKIELLLIKNITRRYFLKVFPAFKEGKLEEIPGVEKYITPMQCDEVILEPNAGKMKFVADGEIRETGTIRVRVIPGAIPVIEPDGKRL